MRIDVVIAEFLAVATAPARCQPDIERGRYLVLIGHCNTCHTAGHMENAGGVAEDALAAGQSRGPAQRRRHQLPETNLRLLVKSDRGRLGQPVEVDAFPPTDAMVEHARHQRSGAARDVPLPPTPGRSGRAGTRIPASGEASAAALRATAEKPR